MAAERHVAQSILAASKSEAYEYVFFLGPYAKRVSFASQQNRVLNLIWALQALDGIRTGQHIAVVGAGLSGLTATAALLEFGYKVTLYDEGSEPLHRQSSARHRYIHPTINRWPTDDIAETTQVPYFDWISDTCYELIKHLRDEWTALIEKWKNSDHLTFTPNVIVTGFVQLPHAPHVAVKTSTTTKVNEERYDACLVTSGFSDELSTDRTTFPTYWRPDHLEQIFNDEPNPRFIVSGCGDGGLIDTLRIAFKGFDDGKLAIEIAQKLTDKWPELGEIRRAETRVANNIGGLASAIRHGSPILKESYEKAAKHLPEKIRKELHSRLRKNYPAGLVTLLSREKVPFSPMAAPIHKLLMAYALSEAVIEYKSGELIDPQEKSISFTNDEKVKTTIAGHVILRHGAGPNFRRFFSSDSETAELISRQKLLSDGLDLAIWSEGEKKLKAWPPKPNLADLAQRKGQAEKLLFRLLGGLKGYFALDESVGFTLDYPSECAADIDRLPRTIFGFPLVARALNNYPPHSTVAAGSSSPSHAKERVKDGLYPGKPILSGLEGRLGPILLDDKGAPYALTAAHVTSMEFGKVLGLDGSNIGSLLETLPGVKANEMTNALSHDVRLIKLDRSSSITSEYAGFNTIAEWVDNPNDVFGKTVFMERRDGTKSIGYVSASRIAISVSSPLQKPLVISGAIRIRPIKEDAEFAKRGDSGAPIVDAAGRLLGIVISTDDENFTYALSVTTIARTFRLRLLDGALPSIGEKPYKTPLSLLNTLKDLAAAIRRDQERQALYSEEPQSELEDIP